MNITEKISSFHSLYIKQNITYPTITDNFCISSLNKILGFVLVPGIRRIYNSYHDLKMTLTDALLGHIPC